MDNQIRRPVPPWREPEGKSFGGKSWTTPELAGNTHPGR
jgi:hypothetical protein